MEAARLSSATCRRRDNSACQRLMPSAFKSTELTTAQPVSGNIHAEVQFEDARQLDLVTMGC